jgi:hypothetical protein
MTDIHKFSAPIAKRNQWRIMGVALINILEGPACGKEWSRLALVLT